MRCAYCQREFSRGHRWLRSKAWCSGACRRRMTTEVRDLMLWMAQWGAAVERPDVIARHDDLLKRYVHATVQPPAAEPAAVTRFPYVDLGEVPLTSKSASRSR